MLAISDSVMSQFNAQAAADYNRMLRAWLSSQTELASRLATATPEWCDTVIAAGQNWNIRMEEDIARLARLWLMRGADWLHSDAASEILNSQRDGELKVFQLECLHKGIGNG